MALIQQNLFQKINMTVKYISGLLQTSTFNSKITEIEGKITTAESKIPDITNLVNKTIKECRK